jgi:hypothetical protein
MRPRLRFTIAAALALGLFACGDDDGGDAGPADSGPDEDAGPLACDAPDMVCPEEPPYPNGRCVGTLDCPYEHPMVPGPGVWSFQCIDGAWRENLACGGCPPQTHEVCRTPTTEGMAGARVTSGLADGATVMLVTGGQGGSMIQHTVNLSGIADLDDRRCVMVRQRVTLEGVPAELSVPVRLRCGRSLPMFAILPDCPREPRLYAMTLEIEVEGAGMETIDLSVMGGLCPRGGFDGDAGPPPDAGP